MALRYTIQYADPQGSFPLTHDAAWHRYSTTDDAAEALSDVADARSSSLDGYAVRLLDGDDVILTDVPIVVTDPEDELPAVAAEVLADATAEAWRTVENNVRDEPTAADYASDIVNHLAHVYDVKVYER